MNDPEGFAPPVLPRREQRQHAPEGLPAAMPVQGAQARALLANPLRSRKGVVMLGIAASICAIVAIVAGSLALNTAEGAADRPNVAVAVNENTAADAISQVGPCLATGSEGAAACDATLAPDAIENASDGDRTETPDGDDTDAQPPTTPGTGTTPGTATPGQSTPETAPAAPSTPGTTTPAAPQPGTTDPGQGTPGTTAPGTGTPGTTPPVTTTPPPEPTAPPAPAPAPLGFAGKTESYGLNLLGIKVLSSYTLSLTGQPGSTASVRYGGLSAGSVTFDGAGSASLSIGGGLLNLGLINPTIKVSYSDGTAGSSISAKRDSI